MIEVKITGHTMAEIFSQIDGMARGDYEGDALTWDPVKPVDPKGEIKPNSPTEEKPDKAEPDSSTEETAEPDLPTEENPDKPTIKKVDIQKRAKEVLDAKHRDELKALFLEFNAQKLSDLPEADYPAFYEKMGGLLNG